MSFSCHETCVERANCFPDEPFNISYTPCTHPVPRQVNKEFPIPLRPRDRRHAKAFDHHTEPARRLRHLTNRRALFSGVSDHPSLPHLSFAHFKLWLDESDDLTVRRKKLPDDRKNKRKRDEGNVNYDEIG